MEKLLKLCFCINRIIYDKEGSNIQFKNFIIQQNDKYILKLVFVNVNRDSGHSIYFWLDVCHVRYSECIISFRITKQEKKFNAYMKDVNKYIKVSI